MNNTFFLDSDIFETKYTIIRMKQNSLVLRDKQSKKLIMAHRRIINIILSTKEPILCSIIERTYVSNKIGWLATMLTI